VRDKHINSQGSVETLFMRGGKRFEANLAKRHRVKGVVYEIITVQTAYISMKM